MAKKKLSLRSFFFLTALLTVLIAGQLHGQEQGAIAGGQAQQKEIWAGDLDVKVAKLRLEFHVTQDKDNKYTGTMISLDQGNGEIPLDVFEINDGQMKFGIKKLAINFEGKLSPDMKSATGDFQQGPVKFPLTLNWVDSNKKFEHTQTWAGKMTAGKQKFDFQFRVYESEGEKPKVKLDSFTESDFGRTAQMTRDGQTVTITIPSTNAKVVGELNEQQDRLDAKWFQRGAELELKLRKIALGQTRDPKVKRPQTPLPPYEFDSVDVTIPTGNHKLAASFTFPKGKRGPFPTVVLISGSGPQDRDETIYNHKPFLVIADHLAKKGIAVLRYDERGVGESTGEFSNATTRDFANDVNAIVDSLKTGPLNAKVNAKKIALVGHSEGGIVGPMVAAARDDIATIVMMAGPGVPGKQIILNQSRAISRVSGADQKTLELQESFLKNVLDVSPAERTAEFFDHLKKNWKDENDGQVDELDAAMNLAQQSLNSPWMNFFTVHDPRPDLEKIKIPVLAIVGSNDLQVDPELNNPAIEKALKKGGNRDFKITVLPGLNHLFQESKTGSPSEYPAIEQTIAPAALNAISDWLTLKIGG